MRSMTESNLAVRAGDHPVHGTWLSVDVVALTDDPEPKIVLIERAGAPHKGEITLPGGLLAAWEGRPSSSARSASCETKPALR